MSIFEQFSMFTQYDTQKYDLKSNVRQNMLKSRYGVSTHMNQYGYYTKFKIIHF